MAVNLINLVADMETLAFFIETQEIPESGQLPRAADNLEGSIRISYAHWPLGRSPTAAARTARGVGRLGKTAR